MQTGKAGDLPLRNTILIKHRDAEPEITIRACVKHVLACADPPDGPAHLRESQNHGALPVPMVDRQPVRCSVSACRYKRQYGHYRNTVHLKEHLTVGPPQA